MTNVAAKMGIATPKVIPTINPRDVVGAEGEYLTVYDLIIINLNLPTSLTSACRCMHVHMGVCVYCNVCPSCHIQI